LSDKVHLGVIEHDRCGEADVLKAQAAVDEINSVIELASKLALALADEVAFHGEENCADASLEVLEQARDLLGLQKEFEEIDSLKGESDETE
jgi:hypothetical protein